MIDEELFQVECFLGIFDLLLVPEAPMSRCIVDFVAAELVFDQNFAHDIRQELLLPNGFLVAMLIVFLLSLLL